MREAQAKRREDDREQAIRNKAAQAQLQKQVIEFLFLSPLSLLQPRLPVLASTTSDTTLRVTAGALCLRNTEAKAKHVASINKHKKNCYCFFVLCEASKTKSVRKR